jgi:hypothetical protein
VRTEPRLAGCEFDGTPDFRHGPEMRQKLNQAQVKISYSLQIPDENAIGSKKDRDKRTTTS